MTATQANQIIVLLERQVALIERQITLQQKILDHLNGVKPAGTGA